jgi:hypothetical protein
MGPRNRRRATAGAIGVGVVAAVVAVVLVIRPHDQSGSGSDAGRRTGSGPIAAVTLLPITSKLTYGMSKRQVISRVGKPDKALRDPNGMNCLQYTVHEQPQGPSQSTLDAVRVCFYSGEYSAAHFEIDGKWDYGPSPKIKITG